MTTQTAIPSLMDNLPNTHVNSFSNFNMAANVDNNYSIINNNDNITAAFLTTTTTNNNNISIMNGMTTFGPTSPEMEPIPFTSKVILVIMYSFITIAAVVGNSLAIIVFAQGKRSKTDLRPFLINLAVADLIMAIFCIPFTFAYQITNHWVFSKPMCHIVQSCQVVSVTASVCTNTCIGIDRLIAVKCPLRKRVTNSRSKVVIVFVWIFAWCMGVFPLVMGNTRESDGKIICEEKFPDTQSQLAYSFFVMIVTYFLPVTILTVTYSMISHQLWNRSIPGHSDDMRDAHQLKSKRKVVKMLSTVVLLFGLCWLPLHLFIIIIAFKLSVFGDAVNEIYFGVHWLSMANSFVNPVIYGFMNDNFRADLRNLCQACLCRQGQRGFINRSPALRWRAGHNVHDSFSPESHLHSHNNHHNNHHLHPHHHQQSVISTATSLLRQDVEMKSAAKPILWQNGRSGKSGLALKKQSNNGGGGGGCGACDGGGNVGQCHERTDNALSNCKTKNRIWTPKNAREVSRRNERNGTKQQVRYGLVRNGACDGASCNGNGRDGATCNGCENSMVNNGGFHQQHPKKNHRSDCLS